MKRILINRIKRNQILILLLAVLVVSSCKKSYFYDGINDDPSQLKDPVPSNLLAGVIQSTGYLVGGDASRFTSNFMQQVTGSANQSLLANNYEVSADDVDNMWTAGLYPSIMGNANSLIKVAETKNQRHYAAVGRILMAYNLGLATDLWGDVPYTEAFLGKANLQPKYDSQASIYTTLDNLLATAITTLSTDDGSPFQPGDKGEDMLFGGNLQRWSRFAHSLRAKFYLHQAKRDNTNYAKAIAEAALGFLPGEMAAVNFSGTSVGTQNPWAQFNEQRGDIAFTGTIYNKLAAAADPRLEAYQTVDGGDILLGPLYGSSNSPVVLMSYDELKFVEAEAHFQKPGQDRIAAAAAYNAGVVANLTRTVNDASYAVVVAKTAVTITLNDIMTQKYYALFLNPEVWTDWRRTGLPVLTAPAGSSLGGALPRSLLYPSGEQRYNSNAPKNTSMLRRVGWDVQ